MEPRKAAVSLVYNGANATGQIAPYLASFQYTDIASDSSDSINIEINDRDHMWIGAACRRISDHRIHRTK